MISDANAALSADTGGRRIGLTNDFSRPLQGVMADASSYYLLGYESPATAADGKFRKIDVDVRRGGVRVIARTGYWAPRPEDLRTSAAASAGPTIPPEVAEALDSLRDQSRRIARRRLDWRPAARVWTKPGHGGLRDPGRARGAARRRRSNSTSRGPTASSRTARRSRSRPACGLLRFVAPPGRLRIRATVKNAAGEEIDSWSHDTVVPVAADASQVGTPDRLPAGQRRCSTAR